MRRSGGAEILQHGFDVGAPRRRVVLQQGLQRGLEREQAGDVDRLGLQRQMRARASQRAADSDTQVRREPDIRVEHPLRTAHRKLERPRSIAARAQHSTATALFGQGGKIRAVELHLLQRVPGNQRTRRTDAGTATAQRRGLDVHVVQRDGRRRQPVEAKLERGTGGKRHRRQRQR